MRYLLLLLLAGPVWAKDPLLTEARAWKVAVTVEARARPPTDGKGTETQYEHAEFLLVTKPPRRPEDGPAVDFEMRRGEGDYRVKIDMVESRKGKAVVTKGSAAGRLFVSITGAVSAATGHYRFRIQATRRQFTVHTTLSGQHHGRFTTFRLADTRRSYMRDLLLEGQVKQEGALLEGRREFVDKQNKFVRDVVVTWRFERIDPVLKGRVTDHLGRPVEGAEIIARTSIGAGRRNFLRKAKTDADGRFVIDAMWGTWWLLVTPELRGQVVYANRGFRTVALNFEKVQPADMTVDAFRLRALLDFHLLRAHFRGDVRGFLDYTLPRMHPRRIELAKLRPGTG